MTTPPFDHLASVPGTDLRWVGTEMMSREMYEFVKPLCNGSYQAENGEVIRSWVWTPQTVENYHNWRLRQHHLAAADHQARSTIGPELDMSEYFAQIDDQKPSGYVSRRPAR